LLSRTRFLLLLVPFFGLFTAAEVGCGSAETNAVTSSPLYGTYGRDGDGHWGYYGYYGCTDGYGYYDEVYGYGCDDGKAHCSFGTDAYGYYGCF
jgi:hypothetical protein